MSISSEIKRIVDAKNALSAAINAKGGNLTGTQLLDDYAAAVTALPTGESADLSFITASAEDILSGKVGADADGNPVYGTIQTVTATLSDNKVTVPKGHIANEQTLTVAEMAEPSVSANAVTIGKGYSKAQKTVTIPEAGELTVSENIVTVPVGYVKSVRTVEIPAVSATLSGNKVTIPAGYNGGQTLTVAEAKAPEVDGNVITIYPGYVAQEQTVEVEIPAGGTSMEFYKCAAVDTSAKTWTGYKAVLTNGVYTFEETLTTGLTYGNGFTPVIDSIYSADGMIAVKNMWDYEWSFLRFQVDAVKSGTEIQLSEITLVDASGNDASWADLGVKSTSGNPDFYASSGEGVDKLFDNNLNTKFCSTSFPKPAWVQVELAAPFSIVDYPQYRWYTAGDWEARDPVSWSVFVSKDGKNWVLADEHLNAEVTSDRKTAVGTWGLLAPYSGSPEVVFYAPLSATAATAETGQTLTVSGNVTYGTVDGISCATFDGNSDIAFPDAGMPTGTAARTLSCWCKINSIETNSNPALFGYGVRENGKFCGLFIESDGKVVFSGYNEQNHLYSPAGAVSVGKWYHVAAVKNGASEKLYINGVKVAEGTTGKNTELALGTIAYTTDTTAHKFNGSLAACRIYNGALSDSEVAELAEEFTPQSGGADAIFYAPLSEAKTTAETGQSLTANGSVSYTTIDEKKCAVLDSGSYISVGEIAGLSAGGEDRTLACWAKAESNSSSRHALIGYGYDVTDAGFYLEFRNNTIAVCGAQSTSNEGYGNKTVDVSAWHHYALVYRSGVVYFFIDGVSCGTFEYAYSTNGVDRILIGILPDFRTGTNKKYIADVRIYNRALSDSEIAELAGEFNT